MDRRIIQLYDEYTHAPLDRRVFIQRLTTITGSAAAAYALLPVLENNYASAQLVSPDDPDIAVDTIMFDGATGPVAGYLVKPAGLDKAPAVIVIHENRGLNPHIQDVARKAAKAGFLALAPDLLSPLGGTPTDEDKARELLGQLDDAQTVANLQAAVAFLAAHAASTGKVGAVGFCWGGGMVNQLAVAEPELDAAVVFYGSSPAAEDVARIQAPLLLNYAGLDERINASVPAFVDALDTAGKRYEMHMYEGANHAFHNDTNAARYNAEAAALAWSRTVEFFAKELG